MKKLINILLVLILPVFAFGQMGDSLLQPKPILNDSLIINNTDLKVYLLFESENNIFLWDGINICQNDFLVIRVGIGFNFMITSAGLYTCEKLDTICNKPKIKINGFYTNMNYKELKNDDFKIIYEIGKKSFKSRFGKIVVSRQSGCMDTGRNPIKIVRKGKTLQFNDIGNLIFFKLDSDNDGKTELYIVNFFVCEGRLEIYKVDDK